MRPGTKKCILLLLAILMLCLLAWRLTPHTFEEITASDQNAITSLAGAATFLGVRDGRAYTESYARRTFCRRTRRLKAFLCF